MLTRNSSIATGEREAAITPGVDHRTVTGGGGARLHVVETGNPNGRPILFLHGFSQSWLAWRRQMCSDLADDHRLVAMDLRGHGRSDKPRDGYAECPLWAEDIAAVLRELALKQPILCGWSYGTIVILDYLRKFGEETIAGVGIVDGITKLGSDEALSVLTPELLNLIPGFFADDTEESVRSLTALLRLCFVREPTPEDLYTMLGYNLTVPPSVRQALLSRIVDNDDLLPTIRKPVLVIHGAVDAVVKPSVVEQHKAGIAHAQVHVMTGAGHAPFWDDTQTFDRHLRTFCKGL
jgi:pimeloyl-ACP methyl ester carboxylesterase